jgi:lipopolysaccharide transport system ATP-binding protein
MSSESSIVVNNVSKRYRLYQKPSDRLKQLFGFGRRQYFKEFNALSDISLTLHKGEVLGIVGANGAGKSTLLQLIAGTIRPTTGTATSTGRVAALLELGSGFNPEFTGRENIYLNAATLGLEKKEIDARLDEIIAFADIGIHIDQPVKTYSSGMHVRLAFSIATSVEPDILIVDEALSVGDGAFARRSFDRIMKIKEQGATVLFCSHTLFHIEYFCDRALWLHQGAVMQLGPVSQVLPRYQEFLDGKTDPVPPTSLQSHGLSTPPSHTEATVPQQDSAPLSESDSSVLPVQLEGHARIEAVTVILDDIEGKDLSGTSGVSTLVMQIKFKSDPLQPAPSAALVLSTEGGRILTTHLSSADHAQFARDPAGNGVAEIRVDNIPLNKGRFRVGAYLLCEKGSHVYQWIDPVAHLQLDHAGLNQGYFLINAKWSN